MIFSTRFFTPNTMSIYNGIIWKKAHFHCCGGRPIHLSLSISCIYSMRVIVCIMIYLPQCNSNGRQTILRSWLALYRARAHTHAVAGIKRRGKCRISNNSSLSRCTKPSNLWSRTQIIVFNQNPNLNWSA